MTRFTPQVDDEDLRPVIRQRLDARRASKQQPTDLRGVIRERLAARQARQQAPDEEKFRKWYGEQVRFLATKGQRLNPDPDAPEHRYDYRKAWRAGAVPTLTEHDDYRWPDLGKLPGHPVPAAKVAPSPQPQTEGEDMRALIRERLAARKGRAEPQAAPARPAEPGPLQPAAKVPTTAPTPGKEVPPRFRAGVSIPTPEEIQRRPMDWTLPEEARQPAWARKGEELVAAAVGVSAVTPPGALLLHKVLIPWMEKRAPGSGERLKKEIARQRRLSVTRVLTKEEVKKKFGKYTPGESLWTTTRRAQAMKAASVPTWVPFVGAGHDPVAEAFTLWMNMGLVGAVGGAIGAPAPAPAPGVGLAPPPVPATVGSILTGASRQAPYTGGWVGSMRFAQELNRSGDVGKALEEGSKGALLGFGIGLIFGLTLNASQIRTLAANRAFRTAYARATKAAKVGDPKGFVAAQERLVRVSKAIHKARGDTAGVAASDKALASLAEKRTLAGQADVLQELKAWGALPATGGVTQAEVVGTAEAFARQHSVPVSAVERGAAVAKKLELAGRAPQEVVRALRGFVQKEASGVGARLSGKAAEDVAQSIARINHPETWGVFATPVGPEAAISRGLGRLGLPRAATVARVTGEEAPWFQRPTPRAPSMAAEAAPFPSAVRGIPSSIVREAARALDRLTTQAQAVPPTAQISVAVAALARAARAEGMEVSPEQVQAVAEKLVAERQRIEREEPAPEVEPEKGTEADARRTLAAAGWTVEENPAWTADPENENRYLARATDRTTDLAIESAGDTVEKMLQGLREAEMLDRATPPAAAEAAPAATFYRGIKADVGEIEGDDRFYTLSREVAEEYAAPGKVGGPVGRVVEVPASELPTNLYRAFNKESLAGELGIDPATAQDPGFDAKAKAALQAQGYEGVRYEAGTDPLGGGAEEIHVFGRAAPEAKPEVEQAIAATRKSASKLPKAKRTPDAIRKIAEKQAERFGVAAEEVLRGMGQVPPAEAARAAPPGAAAQYAPAFRLPTGKVIWDAKATTHEDLMGRVSPLMARLIEKAIRGDYATPEDLGWVNKETGAFVVAREGAKLEPAAEAAPEAPPAFPQTPADAARALRIFQIYNETGNEAILEDLPPGAMIPVDMSTLSLDLAKTLKTPRERKGFQQRLVKAAELVEAGEATREELSKEAAAYQQVWGEVDPLPPGLLRYIGLSELAPAASVPSEAPPGAPPKIPPEAPPAAEAPPPTPEKPSPVEERLGRWLRTQSGGQLAKTARTMGILKRPDIAAGLIQRGRAAKHLREVRATVNEAAVDSELDRLGVGVVITPLLDWLKGDKINAWKGLAYATEIKEACAGRPALAKRFVFKQPPGVRPPGGYLDQDAESAERDPDSGFRGTGPSAFLDQLARESDLRAQMGDVSKLPLPQKLQRLATTAHEAGNEPTAREYERQMDLVLQAEEWEVEVTDALRESVGRYIESKAPGAGLEWARATPAAREAAEQLGVFLSEVSATGKDGAILEKDVRLSALTRDKALTAKGRELRQKIRAVVAEKGLPESEWRKLAKDVSGQRRLTATRVSEAHLQEILRRVQAARPHRVRRGTGFVQVIRPKTEQKIQTLRERLGTIGQMTDADFQGILDGMGIKEPLYVNARRFVTETQGHDILRNMLDEAPTIAKRTALESALAFPHEKAPRNVRAAWETVDRLIKAKGARATEKPSPAKVSPFWDMRYFSQFIEERTGAPMFAAVQEVLDVRAGIQREVETGIHDRLAQAVSERELARLTADPEAGARIEAWLAGELRRGGPEKPADITPTEIKAAETIQAILKEYELPVRIARFYDYWENDAPIPDATPEQLRTASDILETRGHEALAEHLAGQTWGVIGSGYTPLSVVRAKVRTYQPGPIALGKGHLRSRGGIYLEQERTIFQRLNSYAHQILALTRLRAPIRTFVRVFDQASDRLINPQKVAAMFSTWLDEVRGYAAKYHPMSAFVRRAYAQAMTAVVLIDPRKAVRNKFQNSAFYPDRADFLDPRNKMLSAEDKEYFREHVSQRFGLLQHYFMTAEKPFLGFRHLTEWARKLSLYPLSDETNRWECFWAKTNRVRRALAKHPQDAEAMQRAARMTDLEPVQRREALRVLATDGPEAMARYVAGQVTYNVHFAYDRAMRSPLEQGDVGRILGNLMTFPRSYAQQLLLSARQITHGGTPGVRVRGFKKFINLILGALLAGGVYQLVTGDKRNPYHPLNVLNWNVGGLAVGAIQGGFETLYDISQAIRGDERALGRLTTSIPRSADLFVPFYRHLIFAVEGVTGYKDLDRLALRKIRAMVDERYGGPATERYKVMRNAIQTMQKILFGSEPPEEEKDETPKTGVPRPAAPRAPQKPRAPRRPSRPAYGKE